VSGLVGGLLESLRVGLLPVAFTAEFDDVGVMDQPVDGGDGHHVVREDAIPGAERLVGGDDHAAGLVAVGDQFEEHGGLGFAAHMIENELRGKMSLIDKALGLQALKVEIETESGAELSRNALVRKLAESGYTISKRHLIRFQYAAETLYPLIPTALRSGMGRPQVDALRALETAFRAYWIDAGRDPDPFQTIWKDALLMLDGPEFDVALARQGLESRLAGLLEHPVSRIRIAVDALLSGRRGSIEELEDGEPPSPPTVPGTAPDSDVSTSDAPPEGERSATGAEVAAPPASVPSDTISPDTSGGGSSQTAPPPAVPEASSDLRATGAAAGDDPYADWYLLQTLENLEQGREELERLEQDVEGLLQGIQGVDISVAESQKPARIPLQFANPYGYMGAYLISDYDRFARAVLTARHVGLLDRDSSERLLSKGGRLVRRAFASTQGYKHCAVTRDDMAANNARARDAITAMGELPQDVLTGETRPRIAPEVRRSVAGWMASGEAHGGSLDDLAAARKGQAPEPSGDRDRGLPIARRVANVAGDRGSAAAQRAL
jgi:integrating conjugative element protein (TIGR03761 family)